MRTKAKRLNAVKTTGNSYSLNGVENLDKRFEQNAQRVLRLTEALSEIHKNEMRSEKITEQKPDNNILCACVLFVLKHSSFFFAALLCFF